ncbi:hypothetical protein HYPP_02611 [Hyphomicrobium sp. ghe19]|nr:hypothetical protein HYPP_02611 [Hyphomicrobium sp. ghe19]
MYPPTAYDHIEQEGLVKTDFQLTIHHTDGSTYWKVMQSETLDRIRLAIVKMTLEGYSYADGEEKIFVSPHYITKVALKDVGEKIEVKTKTNDKTAAVPTNSKRKATKPKAK